MSRAHDILELLVDDYLKFSGFFTINNVKFRQSLKLATAVRAMCCAVKSEP